MKVLIVNTVPTQKNGITNVIFNLLKYMEHFHIHFGYVAISEPDETYSGYLNNMKIPLYIIPRKEFYFYKYIHSLKDIAKDYDIIHVHGNSATMVLEMFAAKLGGIKARIAHCHNTTCTNKLLNMIIRPVFYKLCNYRLACGSDAGKWLYGTNPFSIINNGVDTDRFRFNNRKRQEIRSKFNAEDSLVFGNIGNFIEQKNHKFLIDIFYIIHKYSPNAKLLLMGNGHLLNTIQNKIKILNLENNVIILGSVSNPQDYLNALDTFIMPSLYEGLPLSLIETQCNGLPILAADTIAKEANLVGNIDFMSLTESAEIWANRAIHMAKNSVRDLNNSNISISKIENKGYSIEFSAMRLMDFYNKIL